MPKKSFNDDSIIRGLKAARALISKRNGWIKGAYARRSPSDAQAVYELGDLARCFCADGALRRVSGGPTAGLDCELYESIAHVFKRAIHKVSRRIRFVSIPCWNDRPRTTKALVLKTFDKAIELRKRQITAELKAAAA